MEIDSRTDSLHKRLDDRKFEGCVQLRVQHRMEPRLVEYLNHAVYDGQLITAASILSGRPLKTKLERFLRRGTNFSRTCLWTTWMSCFGKVSVPLGTLRMQS